MPDAAGGPAPIAEQPVPTVAELLMRRSSDPRPAIRVVGSDLTWSWAQLVAECSRRAEWLRSRPECGSLPPDRALHIGVLLENVPEMVFLLGAAAMSGHVLVGLNTTRSPVELAADAAATDCDLLLFGSVHREAGAAVAAAIGRAALCVDDPGYQTEISAAAPDAGTVPVGDADSLVMLIFTSGTSGAPRAVRITNRKITYPGVNLTRLVGPQDVAYVCMPLFHSGAVMAAYAPVLAAGACLVLRPRFSASALLSDVRAYGCTYLHYVGKALSYVLATPPRPDDADNPLRIAFGNEASTATARRFGERFGCYVVDGFGSSETAVSLTPDPSAPAGALGRLPEEIRILDPATGEPCPPGVIGELVNVTGPGLFAGYYNNPVADRQRMRDGWYWSGDLAYQDDDGYVFFAGREIDRIRVDGENFGAAPVELVLREFPGVVEAAVYAVPDAAAGDQVMAALVLTEGSEFDPSAFTTFLTGRDDFSAKWLPRYVRIAAELPQTASNKIIKRQLADQGWQTADALWLRSARDVRFRPFTEQDAAALRAEFETHGRLHLIPGQGA